MSQRGMAYEKRLKYRNMAKLSKLWLREDMITVCMYMRAVNHEERKGIFLIDRRKNFGEIPLNQTKENVGWITGIVPNGKLDQNLQNVLYKLIWKNHQGDVRKLLGSQLLKILASHASCSKARNKNNRAQWKGFGSLCFLVQETNDFRKLCQWSRF